MVKKILLVISILQLLLLSGCWDYIDVENSTILSGLGIDKIDDKYLLTLEILVPQEFTKDATGASPVKIIDIEADTIHQLRSKFNHYISTNLFCTNIRIIILSQSIVEEGISKVLDPLLRDSNMRITVLAMSLDDSPKEILSILSPLTKNQSEALRDSLHLSSKFGNIPQEVNVVDVSSRTINKGIDPYLPIIKIKGEKDKGKETKDLEQSEIKTYTEISELALFSDDKYVNKLIDKEAHVVSLIMNNPFSSLYGINVDGCYYSMYINKNKSKIDVNIKNNLPIYDIDLNINASLIEIGCDIEIDEQRVKEVSKLFENELKKTLRQALTKTQNFESDIIGFGELLREKDNDNWKKVRNNWHKVYSNATFHIDVSIDFDDTGVIRESVFNKETTNGE